MDANSKFMPGLLSYKIVDYGHYGQCLDAKYERRSDGISFTGRYSLIKVEWKIPENFIIENDLDTYLMAPFKLSVLKDSVSNHSDLDWTLASFHHHKEFFEFSEILQAICYPSTCSTYDIDGVLNYINGKYFKNIKLKMLTAESRNDLEEWRPSQIISRLILLILVSVVILASITDHAQPIVQAFDARKNFKKLFSLDTKSNELNRTPGGAQSGDANVSVHSSSDAKISVSIEKNTKFLNGIKAKYLIECVFAHQSIPMVSGYHTLLLPQLRHYQNEHPNFRFLNRIGTINVAKNANISSLLSFLIWYPIFGAKKGKISIFQFIVPRYLRMIPVVLGYQLILFSFNPFGHGPLSNYIYKNVTRNCLNSGWKELVFLSNGVGHQHACNMTGWFLSVDFQLYIVSYFILLIFHRDTKKGLISCLMIIVSGIVVHGCVMHVYDYPAFNDLIPVHKSNRASPHTHLATYPYISSYFIGMLLGYFLVHENSYRMILSTMQIIFISGVYVIITIILHKLNDEKVFDRNIETLIGSMLLPFESFFHCLLIHQLHQHQDWLLTKFLSNYVFKILSKLMFVAFSVSSIVIAYLNISPNVPREMTLTDISIHYIVICNMTLIFSVMAHLIIEAPFANLTKILLTPPTVRKQKRIKFLSSDQNNNENAKKNE